MAAAWRGYLRILEKYPLRTMAGTTGTLMAAGDCISQTVVEGRSLQQYDGIRTGRFFVFGVVVIGPMMRGWYLTLDKLYACKQMAALKMMATDQLCFSPVILSTFITGMAAFRLESLEDIKAKWNRDFLPVLFTNWKIWPIAQLVNFYFMPLQHRVLFVNFVALFWNIYMAYMSERKDPDVAEVSTLEES